MKRQPSEWEKIIANEATDKQLNSKIYKQHLQLNSRKINDLCFFQLTSLLKNHKEPLSQLVTASISLCMYILACNAGDPGSIPGSGNSPGEGIGYPLQCSWASQVAQMVKNPPAMRETWVQSWIGKISWRRAWQPTPVFLPGESPWTEEPGGLRSLWPQRVGHD